MTTYAKGQAWWAGMTLEERKAALGKAEADVAHAANDWAALPPELYPDLVGQMPVEEAPPAGDK